MKRSARPRAWLGLASVIAAATGLACGVGSAEDEGGAGTALAPCTFRSVALMPVAESKALGYSNNSRFLVDARGHAWIAVRSKHGGEYSICLVHAPPPWQDGMKVEQTWLEDRDALQLSAAPQRVAAIAAGADGSIHMAWYSSPSGRSEDHQIHYARFATGEATRIAEERMPFTMPGFDAVATNAKSKIDLWQEHPAIATGPNGDLHLAWEARDPYRRTEQGVPKPGIAYATRTAAGAWSSSGVLDRPPYLQVNDHYPSQSRPAILVDRAGTVHVLCYGGVSGTQQILYGSLAKGGPFSGWKPVAPSSGDQRHIGAALDRDGRLHVAWREGPSSKGGGASPIAIVYSVREPDGRWRKPIRLTRDDENASTPSVGVTDSSVSVAWVAWSAGATNAEGEADNGYPADNNTVDGRLEMASSPLAAGHFGAPVVIDPGPASYPCWAVVAGGAGARSGLAWVSGGKGDAKLRLGRCEKPAP